MIARTLNIQTKQSQHGGIYYHVNLKSDVGVLYRTCLFPKFRGAPVRNFKRWERIVSLLLDGKQLLLGGLTVKSFSLVDADSDVTLLRELSTEEGGE